MQRTTIRIRDIAVPIWVVLPLGIAIAGVAWIDRAVAHFQERTGRAFYGLAGYHYSVPEWGFAYYPGGEAIHKWTTIVPPYTTLAALLLSALVSIARHRNSGWPTVAVLAATHVIITAGFLLVAGYCEINVTGVFI